MPTVAELERLQALIGQLVPLAETQRGELIRAQDWNTVVGALIEVARATLSGDATQTVPPHEHPDQVSPGWLAPSLRALVERGPLADPGAVARVGEIERRVNGLAGRLDNGANDLGELRLKLGDAVTKQLALANDVTTAKRTIEGVGDAREDVLDLRKSLDSVRSDVRSAMELARNLTVDGQPAILQGMADRLKSVEVLRDRLKTPSGELLDASGLEHRLTELTNTLVTQTQLDDALKNRPGKVTADERNRLRDALRTELTETVTDTNTRNSEAIRAETATRLADVDNRITRAVADATPGVRESALATIRPEIQAAVAAAEAAGTARLDSRLTEATEALTRTVVTQVEDVRRSVLPAVQAEIDARVPAALAELRGSIDGLVRRADTIEGRLRTSDDLITGIGSRVEAIALAEETARGTLRQEVNANLDARLVEVNTAVDQRLAQQVAETSNRIDAALIASRDTLRNEARDLANEVTRGQVADMATSLRGEMHGVARDELAGFGDRIPGLVTSQLQSALADLPQIVETQLRAAMADVQTLVDTRMTTAVAEIQAQVNTRVDTAITGLSPQITTAVRDSVSAELPGMVNNAVTTTAPNLIRDQVTAQLSTPANVDRLVTAIRPSVNRLVTERINR